MASTFEPIATTTLGSAASSITFSTIPGTYTDLRLVIVPKGDGPNTYLRFNSDTGSNYSGTYLIGNGTSASSYRETSVTEILLDVRGLDLTSLSLLTVDIFSYAGSTNKTVLGTFSEDKNGSGQVGRLVGLWRSTSTITSLSFRAPGGTFSSGTTATLYGILKA